MSYVFDDGRDSDRAVLDGLSTRSQNVIINMWDSQNLPRPIKPIDVAGYSAAEWLRQPYAGRKTVDDIGRWLKEKGLQIWTREDQRSSDLERWERAELARLKAKYESDDA